MELELVLINGERRRVTLRSPTDSVAAALDRLDDWIETTDGSWVGKQYIVEASRTVDPDASGGELTDHANGRDA